MPKGGADQIPADDPTALGSELGPALASATDGRLSDLRFFRTDWQRGGAATATGVWTAGDGTSREVVVKAPVGPVEHRFTRALAQTDALTPRVAASGTELGAYDLAWLVMERLPGQTLAHGCTKRDVADFIQSAALFYARALDTAGPPDEPPEPVDWARLVDRARAAVQANAIPDQQRWKEALKRVSRSLEGLVAEWRARPARFWRHGDLHLGNAMRRPDGSAWGPAGCVLLDLDRVEPGHWVADAVYLERVYWDRPEALHKVKPVGAIARELKKLGVDPGEDYQRLATVRRALTAACTPAFLDREGAPARLAAALGVLERSLADIGR
ncbi:MAG: aminoglycoside phosphotransferase family protein [Planctomycetota bacterium]|nr:MAG: aminoglycoside phosphotransferase family protein [Planctomycetota bacterium]